jgi:outer membrane protein TolC
VASQFDLLRARTQLENNRQALISARNQVAISRNAFANTVGVDPSTPVDLADVTQVPPLPALDEGALVATALTQRPEYLQADINILKSQKNTRLARRNLEPFLNAGLNGQYNITAPAFGRDRDTATVSLALTVPLYDGGQTREAVAAARSDERVALIQKDQFVRGIKAEVQQTIISVRDANERATVAASSVREARESLRLANVRYRAGVGTLLEVNDAQTALTQAETNQVNAQYDYLAALARLQRAVGQPQ